MFGVRKAPTGCNFVHNDEIWKDHVHRELQTSRKWPDTWGFLTSQHQVKKGHDELERGEKDKPVKLSSPPEKNHLSNVAVEEKKAVVLEYPVTTAAEVGWRCERGGGLEKFGRHARGQQGIRKLLNWPREAVF